MKRILFSILFVILVSIALLITACVAPPPPVAQSSNPMAAMHALEAANVAVVQRFYDEFSDGKAEVILDVHSETLRMHYAGSAEDVPTQALYEDLAAIKAEIPDLHAEIHTMRGMGDYVFTELTWAGTHTGNLFGLSATGNPIIHNGILVRRLENGLIVESWEIWDDLTLMNGLGFTPSWDEIVEGQVTQ